MTFERDLQLALDPAASEHLPRELHLGKWTYSWTNGKLKSEGRTPGFRQLSAEELRRLMRRLQAAPQHHVILLNLAGHDMRGDMMRELAEPIAALKALQVLALECKSSPVHLFYGVRCIFICCSERDRRLRVRSNCRGTATPLGASSTASRK
jgi:hypothetical protein